ncbi:uncharacterized protein LOC115088567 [Rhinatrema bivittatum]|uniref:uncharacterized protein LOC115088567 n=1 Tax=Rhinatrema bivittatum TaxID=194408 RepID=UPI00112B8C45|nr:uncharacterized protein LOC115088567 [Rhinatrema bivittatum]
MRYEEKKTARHYLTAFAWTRMELDAEIRFANTIFDTAYLRNTITGWKRLGQTLGDAAPVHRMAARWSAVLDSPIAERQMSSWCRDIYRLLPDLSLRELQFKLLHSLYYDDVRWFKMKLATSPTCIKCGTADGTLVHRLITCPLLQPFWHEVLEVVGKCIAGSLRLTARMLLSSMSPRNLPGSCAKARFERVAVLMACRTILAGWIEPQLAPTIAAWFGRMASLAQMERLDFLAGKRRPDPVYCACWDICFATFPKSLQEELCRNGYTLDWSCKVKGKGRGGS